MKESSIIEIYTDGSCHTQSKTGAWAAILLIDGREVFLDGIEKQSTHNKMELLAIIEAIQFLQNKAIPWDGLRIYTDSQYAVQLVEREDRLRKQQFLTKTGRPIRNMELVQNYLSTIASGDIQLIKVKAHQKKGVSINYNRKVDQRVRKIMRREVRSTDEPKTNESTSEI